MAHHRKAVQYRWAVRHRCAATSTLGRPGAADGRPAGREVLKLLPFAAAIAVTRGGGCACEKGRREGYALRRRGHARHRQHLREQPNSNSGRRATSRMERRGTRSGGRHSAPTQRHRPRCGSRPGASADDPHRAELRTSVKQPLSPVPRQNHRVGQALAAWRSTRPNSPKAGTGRRFGFLRLGASGW